MPRFSAPEKPAAGNDFEAVMAKAKATAMQGVAEYDRKAAAMAAKVEELREALWNGKTDVYEDDFFRYESSTEKTGEKSSVPFENVEVGSIKVYDKSKSNEEVVTLAVYRPLADSAANELKEYRTHQDAWRMEAEALNLSHADRLNYQEKKSSEYINANGILKYWLEREEQRDGMDQKV